MYNHRSDPISDGLLNIYCHATLIKYPVTREQSARGAKRARRGISSTEQGGKGQGPKGEGAEGGARLIN